MLGSPCLIPVLQILSLLPLLPLPLLPRARSLPQSSCGSPQDRGAVFLGAVARRQPSAASGGIGIAPKYDSEQLLRLAELANDSQKQVLRAGCKFLRLVGIRGRALRGSGE